MLVTDHHLPGPQLPPADVIVDPNLDGDAFPSKSLAGVGVIFYVLMAVPLKSYGQPFIILAIIPFGFVGAILGHLYLGLALSLLSLFGMLALAGVVVNDSLLLVNRYNEQRRLGQPPRLAMVKAGCARMRAILLTSVTTYAGLAPLIAETSENAQFLIPAAVAMGYGILFATLITLILVPTLVIISEDLSPAGFARRRRQRLRRKRLLSLNSGGIESR